MLLNEHWKIFLNLSALISTTEAATDSRPTRFHRAKFKVSYTFIEKESSIEYIRYSIYNFTVSRLTLM